MSAAALARCRGSAMPSAEALAEQLADDVIAAVAETGDENLVIEINKILEAASTTMQEAYMTAIRVRRAEQKARQFLETRLQKVRTAAPVAAPSPAASAGAAQPMAAPAPKALSPAAGPAGQSALRPAQAQVQPQTRPVTKPPSQPGPQPQQAPHRHPRPNDRPT